MTDMSSDRDQPRATIRVLDSEAGDDRLVLGERPAYRIGRGESCDLQIKDRSVSREHSRVEFDGTYYWLVDCGSANGTLVNEERVQRYMLYDGDIIRIGKVSMVFRAERAAEA